MDALAKECNELFTANARDLFVLDPWMVRDAYGSVVGQDGAVLTEFARAHVQNATDSSAVQRAQQLLELERAVLRTFTSCAWFFDDVARIETRQVLRYAARAIELSGAADRLQPPLLKKLAEATSNVREQGNAADLYMREALPPVAPPMPVAAAAGALRLHGVELKQIASYDISFDTGRDWNAMIVCTHHRRTGASTRHTVQFSGTGIDTTFTVIDLDRTFESVQLAISDLPENEARQLLMIWSNSID